MHRWKRLFLLTAPLLAAGCGLQLPGEYPVSEYSKRQLLGDAAPNEPFELPAEAQTQLKKILDSNFGKPTQPDMRAHLTDEQFEDLQQGAQLYQVHCIHCHGLAGGGDGPTAPFLFPRPRDYRRGVFKWKSTTLSSKPTREDLLSLIKNGAMGTSMPPFRLMPEQELNRLVDYVVFLSKRGELERKVLQAYDADGEMPDDAAVAEMIGEINTSWTNAGENVVATEGARESYPEESPEYEASLARGKALFLGEKAACYKCHGNDGKADPSKMAAEERKKNVDAWGNTNYPRDLTLGMFRGGRRPVDIYRRIHQGIAGASMPEGGRNLKPAEIWDLVNFVRAIPYRPDLLPVAKPAESEHGHGSHGGH